MTGGNPSVIPGTDSELVGADALIGPMGNVLKPKWVDVGIDPYGFLRRFSKPGSILCPHPSRLCRATFPVGEGLENGTGSQ